MTKIWFKLADPTVIISTGKSVGNPDEDFIASTVLLETAIPVIITTKKKLYRRRNGFLNTTH